MKSTLFAAASLFLLAFVSGCVSADRLNAIRIGMTKDQVIEIMGKPDSMSAQSNVEYLTYYLAPNNEEVRDQPYMVRLVDGKVESFGRFAQLFDLYNRPVTNARPGDPNFPQGTSYGYGTAIVTSPAPAPSSIVTDLQKLKALKDQGVLTEAEFEKAKAKLLAEQK